MSDSGPRLARRQRLWGRIATLVMLVLMASVFLFWPAARRFLEEVLDYLWAGDFVGLAGYLRGFEDTAWLVSSLLMILQALAAPVPAVAITLTNAVIYGPWLGALLSWSSALVAAVICWAIGASLGRPFVEALFGRQRLLAFDRFFERHGTLTILVSRLIPFVSFDLVSYAAGLTTIRLRAFILATALGQIPATLAYSFAGSRMTESPSEALQIALIFLGPAALLCAFFWYRRGRSGTSASE